MISKYSGSTMLELQNRSVEYTALMENVQVFNAVIGEPLPTLPQPTSLSSRASTNSEEKKQITNNGSVGNKGQKNNNLIDLDDIFNNNSISATIQNQNQVQQQQQNNDLLADIFGNSSTNITENTNSIIGLTTGLENLNMNIGNPSMSNLNGTSLNSSSMNNVIDNSNVSLLDDLSDNKPESILNKTLANINDEIEAYHNVEHGFKIFFQSSKLSNHKLKTIAKYINQSNQQLNNFTVQIAVPKVNYFF